MKSVCIDRNYEKKNHYLSGAVDSSGNSRSDLCTGTRHCRAAKPSLESTERRDSSRRRVRVGSSFIFPHNLTNRLSPRSTLAPLYSLNHSFQLSIGRGECLFRMVAMQRCASSSRRGDGLMINDTSSTRGMQSQSSTRHIGLANFCRKREIVINVSFVIL